jgi:hypothetical protein
MKFKITFLLLFLCSISFAQSISGIVVDKEGEPLPGATVYFDGSSYGTTTNLDGLFRINIPAQISATLIVSYVGYEKAYVNNLQFEKRYRIILNEAVESLKEIVLTDNKFSRKQMLAVFRSQFLGETKGGRASKIENEDEIYFSYDNDKFILTAYADKPLIINNPYLGYKVYYDLALFDSKFTYFSINKDNIYSSIYAGTSRFEEIDNSKKRIKNREKAFEGSYLQLFRNMANNKWDKKSFLLFYGKFQDNPDDHFTIKDTLGFKHISIRPQERGLHPKGFVAEFSLLYDKREQSKIIFNTDNFYIDKFGLYTNFEEIYFSGDLSKKKVGEMLPSNYGIE